MARVGWHSKLSGVVGAKTAGKLADHLDVVTVADLLTHYPRRYLEVDEVSTIAELASGELVTLVAKVSHAATHPYQDKRTRRTAFRTEVSAELGDGQIWMTFFDRSSGAARWRLGKLRAGHSVVLSGRFERNRYKGGRWELTHPEIDEVDREVDRLMPIYPIRGKLRSEQVKSAVRVVLDVVSDVPDPLPETLRRQQELVDARTALEWVHRPRDRRQVGAALNRLRFVEAFVAQVALAQRRHHQREVYAEPRTGRPGGLFDAFSERMPFELTRGQRQVEAELLADLAGDHPMHRLLQGEVGSGKTVLALRAMLRVVDSGAQAVLLAPTEVLAQQHHRSITAMLGDLAAGGMLGGAEVATRVALLTGSTAAGARREALLQAASGEAGIVIGTHALLEGTVQFADLGLVVVDEQHRFGVEQRAALVDKAAGSPPHVLVMTATPIPRTVAMTVFGDLETSSLTELPAGREPIQTTVVPVVERPGWLDRVWQRLREEVRSGRQGYVVCPRISGDDDDRVAAEPGQPLAEDDGTGDHDGDGPRPPLAAVEEVASTLADGPLAGLRLAVLHGRLAAEQKEAAMTAFAAGEVDVLVSTTVIEVGVDVGNATAMVVLDADRFGVSQLHQLRGRIGRGGHRGLCLLVTNSAPGSLARSRLDAVAATGDGFRLAELDLELRREGDVLGSEQSGSRRRLRLLSVLRDVEVIEAARAAAVEAVETDPVLRELPTLRSAVEALEESAEYLDKG